MTPDREHTRRLEVARHRGDGGVQFVGRAHVADCAEQAGDDVESSIECEAPHVAAVQRPSQVLLGPHVTIAAGDQSTTLLSGQWDVLTIDGGATTCCHSTIWIRMVGRTFREYAPD